MVFGGLISILIAIWIYRTAVEEKLGNTFYWVVGSFAVYLTVQILMIYLNSVIIDMFDADLGGQYDSENNTANKAIGIKFELLPLIVPFFAVATIRLKLMLKQPYSFKGLFGGIKEMFQSIIQSFKSPSN